MDTVFKPKAAKVWTFLLASLCFLVLAHDASPLDCGSGTCISSKEKGSTGEPLLSICPAVTTGVWSDNKLVQTPVTSTAASTFIPIVTTVNPVDSSTIGVFSYNDFSINLQASIVPGTYNWHMGEFKFSGSFLDFFVDKGLSTELLNVAPSSGGPAFTPFQIPLTINKLSWVTDIIAPVGQLYGALTGDVFSVAGTFNTRLRTVGYLDPPVLVTVEGFGGTPFGQFNPAAPTTYELGGTAVATSGGISSQDLIIDLGTFSVDSSAIAGTVGTIGYRVTFSNPNQPGDSRSVDGSFMVEVKAPEPPTVLLLGFVLIIFCCFQGDRLSKTFREQKLYRWSRS